MFALGPYEYESKESLKAKLKTHLANAQDGRVKHPIAHRKLLYLLYMHPRSEEKIGVGVDQFRIASNVKGSGKSFQLVRIDGSIERFSYKTCIDGLAPTMRSRVVEAFRFCVRDQLVNFRASVVLPTTCALTGKVIQNKKELHVDHRVPFWQLLERFRKENQFSLSAINIAGTGEHLSIMDPELQERWRTFHAEVAELQPALKEENLRKGGEIDA